MGCKDAHQPENAYAAERAGPISTCSSLETQAKVLQGFGANQKTGRDGKTMT